MVDNMFNLLSYCDVDKNPYPLLNYLKLIKSEKPFDQNFIKTIPKDVKELTLSIKRQLVINNQSITCRIKPMIATNKIYGYLIVWETVRKLERLDYIVLKVLLRQQRLNKLDLCKLKKLVIDKERTF